MSVKLNFNHNNDIHSGEVTFNRDGSFIYQMGYQACNGLSVRVEGGLNAKEQGALALVSTNRRDGGKVLEEDKVGLGYVVIERGDSLLQMFDARGGAQIDIQVDGLGPANSRDQRYLSTVIAIVRAVVDYVYAAYSDYQCSRIAGNCHRRGCASVDVKTTGTGTSRKCEVSCGDC